MKRSVPSSLLSRIVVETPCREDWNSMCGDERLRHCGRCKKNVYNLSELTEPEAIELLSSGKAICMRLFRRPDGTVLTKECGVGLRRRWGAHAAATAAVFALLSFLGLRQATAEDAPQPQPPPDFHEIAGGIRPMPRELLLGKVLVATATPSPEPEREGEAQD
ncbi:MAG: hypothetical protein J0M12_13185 [Deltaproteobacteria bacterium]|nr:hypothetical protein [Deltaproteobacteria bacterium]